MPAKKSAKAKRKKSSKKTARKKRAKKVTKKKTAKKPSKKKAKKTARKSARKPKKKAASSKSKRSRKKLSQKQLERYKKLLFKLRDDILGDIKNMRGESGELDSKDVSGHVIHMADVATDMYDKEFNMGLASKDREILQKIEDALRRIEDGTYGFCLATGKPISSARLKAIPYAEYCLAYQEELENNGQYR